MGHHHNHTCHAAHSHSRSKRFGITIIFNFLITLAEYIGGVLSGSLALISDATHNLSDTLSLIFGYIGEKTSEKEPDLEYSFGLKRMEVITALINALALYVIGIIIIVAAVWRWQDPAPVAIGIMLPVAFIGLVGNVLSIFVLGRQDSNINVRAAFLHLLYDAITSVAVIITAIIMHVSSYYWLDPLVSVFIVLMMGYSGYGILDEALRIILQISPRHIDTQAVSDAVIEISGAQNVHGLHIWSVNSTEVFLSCHIYIDDSDKLCDTDKIISKVNAMLNERFGITHTTLQIDKSDICSCH